MLYTVCMSLRYHFWFLQMQIVRLVSSPMRASLQLVISRWVYIDSRVCMLPAICYKQPSVSIDNGAHGAIVHNTIGIVKLPC